MTGRRVSQLAMLFVACAFAIASAATNSLEVAAVFCRGKAEYGQFFDVPLGSPIKVEFNQPVTLNPSRLTADFIRLTQVTIRSDGTCQLNGHPVNIPWTLSTDKKTLTLYLSEVLRGYLKGAQSYQIVIPHLFFVTTAGRRLSTPFTPTVCL